MQSQEILGKADNKIGKSLTWENQRIKISVEGDRTRWKIKRGRIMAVRVQKSLNPGDIFSFEKLKFFVTVNCESFDNAGNSFNFIHCQILEIILKNTKTRNRWNNLWTMKRIPLKSKVMSQTPLARSILSSTTTLSRLLLMERLLIIRNSHFWKMGC